MTALLFLKCIGCGFLGIAVHLFFEIRDIRKQSVAANNVWSRGVTSANTSTYYIKNEAITPFTITKAGATTITSNIVGGFGFAVQTTGIGNSSGIYVNTGASSTGSPLVAQVNAATALAVNNNLSTTLGGAIQLPIRTVTTAATLGTTDFTVLVNNTAGNVTLTLPAASTCVGRIYNIKKIASGAFTVTIQGNGAELIDASNTSILAIQWEVRSIQSNGIQWFSL